MSDLNPKGIAINVNGEERHFLFTLNAIDKIQSDMEQTVYEVLKGLQDEGTLSQTLKYLVGVLLDDECKRLKALQGIELRGYTEEEIGWIISVDNLLEFMNAIFDAYNASMPKAEGNESPNQKGGSMS